jgi:small subunit ribosomal protein S4
MGDIKKIRKKFQRPSHPWQKERILRENAMVKEYGLKNKTEVWKLISLLANFKRAAKESISSTNKQSMREAEQLLLRLRSIGLLSQTSMLNDVLTLTEKDVMERRLQTIVYRKGYARSLNQARQLIVHSHIKINGRKISSPSYIVKKDEEDKISYAENSALFVADHPERTKISTMPIKAAAVQTSSDKDEKKSATSDKGGPKKRFMKRKREPRKEMPQEKRKIRSDDGE